MKVKSLLWTREQDDEDGVYHTGQPLNGKVMVYIRRFAEDCYTTSWLNGLEEGDYRTLRIAKKEAQRVWNEFVVGLIEP